MALDNSDSLWLSLDVKKEQIDPPHPHNFHGPGEPPRYLSPAEEVDVNDCSSHITMPSESSISRPFPPPSLAGVPHEYILDQLRNLAGNYWNDADTADCTLVIPVPYPRCKPSSAHFSSGTISVRPTYDPSGLGRRATEPCTLNVLPHMTLPLHSDYLSAHSSFLRALFSGSSPIDLINTSSSMEPTPNSPLRTPSGRFTIPADRLPRLLNSSAAHPVLFLPVPDPSSIDLLIHWMYFGDVYWIHDALDKNEIHWEGMARNVEYLGLSNDIKVFLGTWYQRWLHPSGEDFRPTRRCAHSAAPGYASSSETEDDDSGSEMAFSDVDYDDVEDSDYDRDQGRDSDETLVSDMHACLLDEKVSIVDEHTAPHRGRDRATRGLSWTLQYANGFLSPISPVASARAPSPVAPHEMVC